MDSIKGVVQHYFSCRWVMPDRPFNLNHCWELMHDLNFEKEDRVYNIYQGPRIGVSAQYMIGRDGTILQLVPLEFQAWHAGPSHFNGRDNCNEFMVGIENIGKAGVIFTDPQYHSNARLCAWLMNEYGFGYDQITGHEDVALPHGRKKDPGELWNREKHRDLTKNYLQMSGS